LSVTSTCWQTDAAVGKMTLRKRLIACLDVTDGRVVKGTRFIDLVDAGDPVELAQRYASDGADEIVILDIGATVGGRRALLQLIDRAAAALDVPLTVGGGVRSLADAAALLDAGADKVSVNSAALARPQVLTEIAQRLGSQSVLIAIDAVAAGEGWSVRAASATRETGRDAVAWAREAVERGAGEVLLTSIDRDGTRSGYDLALTAAVSRAVSVPVIASGGAGSAEDVARVLIDGGASAALLAGILHSGRTTVTELKAALTERGIAVRDASVRPTPAEVASWLG
jgi:cyclase